MWLVLLGLGMVALKLLAPGVAGSWPWWLVLAPFALAALWWKVADATGITQRRAMQRADERAALRRQSQIDALRQRPPGSSGRRGKAPDGPGSGRG